MSQHNCANRPNPSEAFKQNYCGYEDKHKDDKCNGCRLKFSGWDIEKGERLKDA